MIAGRLVKVMLPAHLVAAMDTFINRSSDYAGRAEVLADALEGFLTEMGTPAEREIATTTSSPVPLKVEPMAPILAAAALELHPAPAGAPIVEPVAGLPRPTFTWGMHNRDFPTLWAAHHLAVSTANAAGAVPFDQWLPTLARDAWRVALALDGDRRLDLSGFPTNAAKWAKAEGRFTTFFVGACDGNGPLFDLGLAGITEDGACALTAAGAAVLGALDGWGCATDVAPTDTRRKAWLTHLATWAPADIALFSVVVDALAGGANSRDSLLLAVAERHDAWTTGQVSTNAAAAISRLREVGLIERRQVNGRYVLGGPSGWAAASLAAARAPTATMLAAAGGRPSHTPARRNKEIAR